MYAVVSSGGKQYRVEPGSTLIVERIAGEAGAPVTFDRVLLLGDGDEVTIGTPLVAGASVSGTLLGERLGPKIIVFKFKQKVKYRRRTGHRQHLMRVRIDAINADGKTTRSKPAATELAADAEAEPEPTAAKPAAKTARPRTRTRTTTKPKEADEPAAPAAADVAASKPRARRVSKPKAETPETAEE
jgi:large subunit ribosomal protein L21